MNNHFYIWLNIEKKVHCFEFLLKKKYSYFDGIFVIGYTDSCQNDNFRFSHSHKFLQSGISFQCVPRVSGRHATVHSKVTSSNASIFLVTGILWGESTGHRWIPLTKASDAELWNFLWSVPDQTVEQTIEIPVIWDAVALIIRHCNAKKSAHMSRFVVFCYS